MFNIITKSPLELPKKEVYYPEVTNQVMQKLTQTHQFFAIP
jgi:hypothetical protein